MIYCKYLGQMIENYKSLKFFRTVEDIQTFSHSAKIAREIAKSKYFSNIKIES